MTRLHRPLVACGLGLLAAALLVAVAASCSSERTQPARSLRSRSCVDCHAPFVESLVARTQHFEGLSTRCEDCHDRHGLVGVLKLKLPETDLCLSCHEDVRGDVEAPHPHGPLAGGRCTDCHDPHGSVEPMLLVATGPALCARCHDDVTHGRELVHAPVADDCLRCHDAHANATPRGLVADVPGLCTACHAVDGEGFAGAHSDYDVSASDCTSCHAPHASADAGLLRDTTHFPFVAGDCTSCHVDPGGAPGTSPARLLAEGGELCIQCHDGEMAEFEGRRSVHAPVVFGDCSACHAAHASDPAGLLRTAPDASLCIDCHDTVQQIALHDGPTGSPHAPASDGDCLACHDPHGGPETPSLRSESTELCLGCHADVSAHFEREVVHAPLAQCTSCHEAHGSERSPLLAASLSETCLACHTELEARMAREDVHRPAALGDCLACHEAHSSDLPGVLRAEPGALCQSCHVDVMDAPGGVARRSAGGSLHAPAVKGECLSCHDPHSAPEGGLLLAQGAALCSSCHGMTQAAIEAAPVRHAPAEGGACLACHDPHRAPREHLLALPPRDLCSTCHSQLFDELIEPGTAAHAPAADGECLTCHVPHAGANEGLVKAPSPELCLTCHSLDAPGMDDAHLDLLDARTDCLECHTPHASPGEGLFWPDRHEAFATGRCDECHTDAGK